MLDQEATFILAEEFVVSDLETLKVLADPLRLSIIEHLERPSTVKHIAEKIDRPPTKLYYHFNLLEKHSLIKTVETRIVSGIVEKHYQAAAKTYRVATHLLTPTASGLDENIEVMLAGMLDKMRRDIAHSLLTGVVQTGDNVAKHRRLMLTQGRFKLSSQQAAAFYDRLMDLLEEFDALSNANEQQVEDAASEEDGSYRITLILHPSSIVMGADEE